MTAVSQTEANVAASAAIPACTHCGERCDRTHIAVDDKHFCCLGCRSVYELLAENRLDRYYQLEESPGQRPAEAANERFGYLDDPVVQEQLLEFRDGELAVARFRIPSIHCVACIWLLENLYRIHPAVSRSQVNFPRKELLIHFDEGLLSLRGLVALLAKLGYEPALSLQNLERRQAVSPNRRLYLRLGVAGFCFANIMLLSFPGYFGLADTVSPGFTRVFGYLSIGLSVPVLLYGASDYLRAAWLAIRQRRITIDLPLAIGIVALYLHSLQMIAAGDGTGYLDSFAGLIFFLLLGRLFQQKTYDALAFDHDYTSYFPVHAMRLGEDGRETSVPLHALETDDRIVVRHHELVPADAELLDEQTEIDYSFVTGESDPVPRRRGESIFAGGRHLGSAARYRVVRPVSRSRLTELWNNPVFNKPKGRDFAAITNHVSKYFTVAVVAVALLAAAFWATVGAASALRVFAAVLIVACPCALAMSAPFTLGTAMRLMERLRCFCRNAPVVENLARIDTIVFDKTGTLTTGSRAGVIDNGTLTEADRCLAKALARHSTHPLSVRLSEAFHELPSRDISAYREEPGQGLEGEVDGHRVRLGSAAWCGAEPALGESTHPTVHLAVDGVWRGRFEVQAGFRPGLAELLRRLAPRYRLALLTGDSARQEHELRQLFGEAVELRFNQTPADKLAYVERLQGEGRRVLMIGDGLNDAGALRCSDVGIAVSDDLSAFSPACDAILAGDGLPRLADLLAFARTALGVIMASFTISIGYNLIGISFAAAGLLSPLISAVLMPVSSISVITFAVVATSILARRQFGRLA